MVNAELITVEQAQKVDVSRIYCFFQTDIGQKIIHGKEVLREFKFSILEDASLYYDNVSNERILLQGVVDCAIVEDNGIVVIDFKTDYITEQNFSEKVSQYSLQIKTYAKALSEIFELPVRESYIYFFHTGQFVPIH